MKIVLFGGTGLVGSRFIDLKQNQFEIISPSSSELDITIHEQLSQYIRKSDAEVVINLAGFTIVDAAEEQKDDENGSAYALNVNAPKFLAESCRETGKHFLHVSTDYVFNGEKDEEPYKEDDITNPVNWYGKTKLLGEEAIREAGGSFTIARIEMPYSANFEKKSDFARFFLDKLKKGEEFKAVDDQKITPIFVDDCVNALTKLAEKKSQGIYHVASTDSTSPFEFATKLAEALGASNELITPVNFEEFNAGRKASRPKNSWLSTEKFQKEFGDKILHINIEGIAKLIEK